MGYGGGKGKTTLPFVLAGSWSRRAVAAAVHREDPAGREPRGSGTHRHEHHGHAHGRQHPRGRRFGPLRGDAEGGRSEDGAVRVGHPSGSERDSIHRGFAEIRWMESLV